MSLLAELSKARLVVLLDLRHPLACLALEPTLEMLDALGLETGPDVDWLPLPVPPLKAPGDAGPDDDRGTRHRRYRAEAIAREIQTYGAAQGRVLEEPYRDGPADAAVRGWLWLRARHRPRLVEGLRALFDAYWRVDLDPADDAQVAAVLDAVEADGPGFRSWSAEAGAREAESLAGRLREIGLFNVPAYVVEDEVFYGRQHLPMIRWILEGRTGRVPI